MRYKKVIGVVLTSALLAGAALAGDVYEIDRAHTRVGFAVKHMVISTVRGEFKDYDATIIIDENDVTRSSLKGSIKVASITTGNEKRDNHLKSPDFFDAAKYPEITFQSKRIEAKGKDRYVMYGDLTIRNVTKEVAIPFIVNGFLNAMGSKRVGIEAEFTINRKDFGLNWNRTLDTGGLVVGDEVKVEISFEGIQKK